MRTGQEQVVADFFTWGQFLEKQLEVIPHQYSKQLEKQIPQSWREIWRTHHNIYYPPICRKQDSVFYSATLAARDGSMIKGHMQFSGLMSKIPLHSHPHSVSPQHKLPVTDDPARTRCHGEYWRFHKTWILNDQDEYCHLAGNISVWIFHKEKSESILLRNRDLGVMCYRRQYYLC